MNVECSGAYRDPVKTRNDLVECLRTNPALQARCAPLANKKGAEQVVYLSGTIPVQYNNASYNIPVAVWIPLSYPAVPPVVYVTPTADMIVKPRHRHVDSAGMTYLPYLSSWSAKTCNLRDLVATMCKVFGADPPVRAKPKNAAPDPGAAAAAAAATTPTEANGGVASLAASNAAGGKAFEDPGAVIKRNAIQAVTEKLRRELKSVYEQLAGEIDELMGAGSGDPTARKQKELRKVRGEVEATLSKNEDLTRWLSTNDKAGDVDIDAITEPRDPLSKQLLHLVASDAALEDCMYYLEKALMAGSLDSAEFLKTYRAISREQFWQRATMKKVHEVQRQAKQGTT
jgi:ESCRT-I complex subunit TSG101